MTTFTAAEVAEQMRVSKRTVTDLATKLGVGANVGGSSGFRFREADIEALWEALRPQVEVTPRRRRRA